MHDYGPPVIGLVLSVLLGWLVGGAANWAADVLPLRREGEDVWRPRGLAPWHYLTLGWYSFRRGICPHCGERRTLRAPLLEFAIILTYVGMRYRLGDDILSLSVGWVYAAYLLTVLVIDLEHRLVLNVMLVPAAVLAFLFSFLPGTPEPLNALLGGLVGFGSFLVLAILGRGKMGAGDVKLAGVIGLMVGYPDVLLALFAGVTLGGLAAIALLVTKRASRKSHMAYAPYLSIGALIMLFWSFGQ